MVVAVRNLGILKRGESIMKNFIMRVVMVIALILVCSSCSKKEPYESNASILKKAIEAGSAGEWEKAKALAFKARTQDPKDPNARVMFALALEQCEDLERAIEEIKIAVSLDPSIFMAQYTKGRLLFDNDIYEDCPAPFEKAKELDPTNPQVLLLLARTYSLLSNYDEAIKNYVQLAKLPEYKDSPEVFNELGVLFFKKKDYKRAIRFLNRAYSLDPKLPSINLNLAVFYETMVPLCGDNKSQALTAMKNAIKYYTDYEELLVSDSHAEATRKEILDKIEELKKQI